VHDSVWPTVNNSLSGCTHKHWKCSYKNKNYPSGYLRGVDPMKTVMRCPYIIGYNLAILEKRTILSVRKSQKIPCLIFQLYNYVVLLPPFSESRPELLFSGST
jgi:hypothetical protein